MEKPLFGEKVAILVANGFNEQDLISMQRLAQDLGAGVSIISMMHGLVNSWNGMGWGLNFAVDALLNESLAVDFDILMMPSGMRSAQKLRTTAHTRRFIGGFMDASKPVIAVGEAMDLMAYAEKIDGKSVAAPEAMAEIVAGAGATMVAEDRMIDGSLMSVKSMTGADMNAMMSAMRDFLVTPSAMKEAA